MNEAEANASDQVTAQFASDPVIGDGVVTFPAEKEVDMPGLDLPEGVGQVMMLESANNMQASNRNSRNVADIAMGALQGTIVQNFKDIGVTEGRSVSGILATPIAGPATGQK